MAVFPITAGNRNAMEVAGAVTINVNAANHDHDLTTDWSGLNFVTGGGGPDEGDTILTATLGVYISTSGADEPDVTIFGHKTIASGVFDNLVASDVSGRAKTTASVPWSNPELSAVGNDLHTGPSMVTMIQELVDQPGWTPSSPITLLIQGSATGSRDFQYRFYDYQGPGGLDPKGTYAPILTVTWESGGGGGGSILLPMMQYSNGGW